MSRKIIIYFFIALTFCGCSTKLDLNALHKDIPVIYGLLDPNDTVQYIRIEKAFLSTQSATDIAQIPDSINYQSGDLDVKIEDLTTNDIFTLTETTVAKDTGYFATAGNLIFKTNHTIHQNDKYKLIVTENKTGKKITATTVIVHNVSVNKPNYPEFPLAGYEVGNPVNYYTRKVDIDFGDNGYSSECYLRFVWLEVSTGGDTTKKHVDIYIGEFNAEDNDHLIEFNTETIFQDLQKLIPNDPDVSKRLLSYDINNPVGGIQFVFYTASEDLRTYIELKKPATGIIQERPNFTNLSDGVGLFSSRNTTISNLTILNQGSVEALENSPYTADLKFTIP